MVHMTDEMKLWLAYLESPDVDAAKQFADEHPELRTLAAVAGLADMARKMEDEDEKWSVVLAAAILCGVDWAEGVVHIENLEQADADLRAAPTDRATQQRALAAARAVGEAVGAHPLIRARVLSAAANTLGRVAKTRSDADLFREALAVDRVALTVPMEDYFRAALLSNCASRLSALHGLTGADSDRDEAIKTMRRALAIVRDHHLRATIVHNLAEMLTALYADTRDQRVLEEALRLRREAVEATAPDS